ncbi:MAG: HAD hydrolase-like protein [bacterium]
MKIAIDLDEVLGDFMSALLEYFNHTYDQNLEYQNVFSYNFWEVWGGSRDGAIQMVYDFHKTDYFANIKPIPGAREALQTLKGLDHDLYIVTSRQNDVIGPTKDWVQKNFPNIFSDIFFTNHFSRDGSVPKTKADICNSLGIQMLVEDSLTYSKECIYPGRKIFLIDRPWNQDKNLPSEIQRVYSWKEIIKKI